jgi:hypothetical protein
MDYHGQFRRGDGEVVGRFGGLSRLPVGTGRASIPGGGDGPDAVLPLPFIAAHDLYAAPPV